MSEPEIPRRGLLVKAATGVLGATYAAAIAYPIYRYIAYAPEERRAENQNLPDFIPVEASKVPGPGTATKLMYGPREILLIHNPDGTMTCFSTKCTHLGCPVVYEPQNERIFCHCHNGIYDPKTGERTGGPPPRPLMKFNVEVKDDSVVISRA